jgi:hypothetical protein
VGSHWKGHAYTKAYTKPANPNTPGQIETRALFKNIAHIGQGLRLPLEQYTRPKPHQMTAYNHLIQLNKPMFNKHGTKWEPLELMIMSGELTSAPITSATFDSVNLSATITWYGSIGEPTDKAFGVIYDDESKRIVYVDEISRSQGTITFDTSSFANVSTYDQVYAYLAFYYINDDGNGVNSLTTAIKADKT